MKINAKRLYYMEKEEKLTYGMVLFLSLLAFNYTQLTSGYNSPLATTLRNLHPWVVFILLILLSIVVLLLGLDFLVARKVPENLIGILSAVYLLILGIFMLLAVLLSQLRI